MVRRIVRPLLALTFALPLALAACEESADAEAPTEAEATETEASSAAAPATDEAPAAEAQQGGQEQNAFVGHYRHSRSDAVRLTLNSQMRVRIGVEDSPCLGDYTIEDGAITMTYDEGQSGCMTMRSEGRLSDDGQELRFGSLAVYERIDSEDETF
ncbi:MAG TPA: hypothetical protein RMH99_26760 [Sandaracinaceae bacterium LLY-WYZ-13_1]|nr:hypothetical protein [Sandaracinaceae bacterium LLY-WYZ-13_1]